MPGAKADRRKADSPGRPASGAVIRPPCGVGAGDHVAAAERRAWAASSSNMANINSDGIRGARCYGVMGALGWKLMSNGTASSEPGRGGQTRPGVPLRAPWGQIVVTLSIIMCHINIVVLSVRTLRPRLRTGIGIAATKGDTSLTNSSPRRRTMTDVQRDIDGVCLSSRLIPLAALRATRMTFIRIYPLSAGSIIQWRHVSDVLIPD
jgi:hypothetical protein